MIIRACGFIQFDTEKDFNTHVQYNYGKPRFECEDIERPNRFPAVYKYHEPWNSLFYGYWKLCEDSEPMLVAITKHITELLETKKKVAKPIDSKQNL